MRSHSFDAAARVRNPPAAIERMVLMRSHSFDAAMRCDGMGASHSHAQPAGPRAARHEAVRQLPQNRNDARRTRVKSTRMLMSTILDRRLTCTYLHPFAMPPIDNTAP
jgi:hypothetical protein